jgi:hypothetical protein
MATQLTKPAWDKSTPCIAFKGSKRIAAGDLAHVALRARAVLDRHAEGEPLIILDCCTSEAIEVDFRGTADDVLRKIPSPNPVPADSRPAKESARGPGRPKLGVIAREVTLLPRHWDWLSEQPGGASVALRKLVENARRDNAGKDRKRTAQESAYRFMSTMAGNRPGFEEATRALYAGDDKRFAMLIQAWPAAIRTHARKLADAALQPEEESGNQLNH